MPFKMTPSQLVVLHNDGENMNLNDDDTLLTEAETANQLNTKSETLAVWRSTKRYPLPYIKIGRSVRYRQGDVRAFIKSRTITQA